jgi:hypothetical protein
MNAPGLHLDFDEMVFHGFAPEQARAIAAFLEKEIAQLAQRHLDVTPDLWKNHGLPANLDLQSLALPPLALNPQAPAGETARSLAQAIWAGVQPSLTPTPAQGTGLT